ncbi:MULTISPECIES: hypothetical protein [unclassified Polaromonas]|jgi:hypothetical protein|uniref:hypothetical protein n=1 Tax=unclassified Polaromonas TaxID=2638319 RepID=UPI000BC689C4|nr:MULTISPECIES: hypothetical protein [unclassified Polaromonas]OYY35761.1 MAG: hypothetical protein B7Y60_11385 [Polaromonas sp. 35-63-35]OYZ19934.1 MAG: hypothetical protein B7Y28_11755 [Polaromonas sp. 16-63-31]OYZ76810.1 MAG: hypothetical protein B7Y09_18815 [Polaromonas sp. 24-63-21]OZA51916.1 MAG: hypothetical protein B7X88_04235 [Polaromonas sp. 17-63-33]OZA88053.1 MAG: hypothetical protein B7X65_11210 [Polaromonas sp. 39-63-25]
MIYAKTETGQQSLKDRSLLSPRQRSAFILFDGKRSVSQVLGATAGLGVTSEELVQLVELGFLTPSQQSVDKAAAANAAAVVARQEDSDASNDRYKKAYPIAAQLTGALGLRGFRLNLAVEGAVDVDALLALLPKIREAVGADKCSELEQALKG